MSFDLVAWMRNDALPLWADAGFDDASGLFVERLDERGCPRADLPRRVMVQARQIAVFAEAQARGWHPGGALAMRAGETMERVFRRDDNGWIFSVTRDARPVDTTIDLYAQAFVLVALASLARLTGTCRWLDLADRTLAFLDAHMATPATGGYAERLPPGRAVRRQNPHMHLFEAMVALDRLRPDGDYRRRAMALATLCEHRFRHGPRRVIVEFYDDDLRPTGAPPFAFEPGHHFEWAWLLSRFAGSSADERLSPPTTRLFDVAWQYGRAPCGLMFDEVDSDGRVLKASTRLWPMTEAIRAMTLPLAPIPPTARAGLRRELTEALAQHFLLPAATGCWSDHLDANGVALATDVPASSLYHLMGAAGAIADAGATSA